MSAGQGPPPVELLVPVAIDDELVVDGPVAVTVLGPAPPAAAVEPRWRSVRSSSEQPAAATIPAAATTLAIGARPRTTKWIVGRTTGRWYASRQASAGRNRVTPYFSDQRRRVAPADALTNVNAARPGPSEPRATTALSAGAKPASSATDA